MSKEKLVPKLRFEEFINKNGWILKKVSDLSNITYGGGTPKTSVVEYWKGKIPWISSSDLKDDIVYSVSPTRYITKEAIANSATKLVPKNSIAVVTRVGVGKLSLIPFEYTTSQDFLSISRIKENELYSAYTLYRLLQTEKNETQGTSIKGITKDELLNKKMYITTNKKEQEKIGSFFKKIDEMIQLQQSKVNKVKDIKSAYLSEMFPKEGEKYPKKRFEGFQDAWLYYTLSNVVNVRSGRDYKHLLSGNIPVYGTGGYMTNVNKALSYNDAIGIGRKGTIDKPYLLNAPFWTVDTLFYVLPQRKSELYFILYIFENINWIQKQETTGVPSLSKMTINNIDILMPANTKEREKIGNFFKNLDNQISIEEEKLAKLEKLKQAYLNDMFV